MKTIGFVHSGFNASFVRQFAAIDTGLAVMGFEKNTDYTIIPKWSDDKAQQLRQNIKDLVANASVDVIIAAGGPNPAIDAMNETAPQTVKKPIVFTTVADPVGNGLRPPDGNLTGMAGETSELDDDRLKLLSEFFGPPSGPQKKVHALFKRGRPKLQQHKIDLATKATGFGLNFGNEEVDDDVGIDKAFEAGMAGADALLVSADAFFNSQREKIVSKAAALRLPAIYQWREFVEIGGLMSYGPSIIEAYVFAGVYAARILKGEKPADIPLSKPTHFELVINRTTERNLGITIPNSLKDRAELIG